MSAGQSVKWASTIRGLPGRAAAVAIVAFCALGLPGSLRGAPQASALAAKKTETLSKPAARSKAPPLILEEKPPWLVPAKPRSEADQDRVEALALFSTARLHEKRQDYSGALRLYERAFRCDPRSATIARAIVPLAVRLNRHGEAVRYALKIVEIEEADPQLLKRLAGYLGETGEYAKALALFEKAVAARKGAKPTADDVALWMDSGRMCFLTGQYAKAAGYFDRVLDALDHPDRIRLDGAAKKAVFPEPAPAYAMMGDAFLQAGQPQKAAAVFEKGQKLVPNKGLLGYQLAKVAWKTGKPEQAIRDLQVYFDARLATEEAAPYQLLADALRALKKDEELVGRLEKLRAADPDNPWLAYFLAETCFEAKRLDQAEKLYRELAAKKPAVIGYRNLVQIYRQGRRYGDLAKVLGDAVGKLGTLDPLAPKGKTLAEDGELVRGVVEAARKQIKADPKSVPYQARLAVGLLAADAKQWDTAGEFFDLAIKAQPDQAAKVLLTWGLGLLLKEENARAVKVLQRGIDEKALPADDPTFPFYLAGALELAGQTGPALAAARKAAELAERRVSGPQAKEAKEELPRYLNRVAWILYHAKRYDEAIKAYEQLLAKFGNEYGSGEIRGAVRETRLVLSNIAVLTSNLPAAEEWLEQVLDEYPDDASALNDLGYLWADQGKHLDRACRMIRQAVEREPDNAAYRDSLGWVLFRKGKVAEALPELEKAAAKESDPTVLEHLGDAYRAAGQAGKGKEAWRKAAEAYRKAHEEQKATKVEEKIKGLGVRD